MKKISIFCILISIVLISSIIYYNIQTQPPKGLKGKIVFWGDIDRGRGYAKKIQSAIGVYDLETGEEKVIFTEDTNWDFGPKISPDEKKIAYTSSNNLDVYVVDVYNNTTTYLKVQDLDYRFINLAWISSNEILVAGCPRQKDKSRFDKGGNFIYNLQNNNLIKIGGEQSTSAAKLCLSSDGKKIAFFKPVEDNNRTYYRLFVANTDGTNVKQVGNVNTRHFAWSPDGKQFCYISEINSRIYIVNADGTNDHRIPNLKHYGWNVDWSPDGKKIIFDHIPQISGTDPREIYIVNIDGTGLKRFYPKGNWSEISSPQWWAPGEDK